MKHHCVKKGPENQRKYIEMRVKALRSQTKRELQSSHASATWRRSGQRNPRETERLDNASATSMSTRNTPLEPPQVDEPQNEPSLPSTDLMSTRGFAAASSLDTQCRQQTTASFPTNAEDPCPSTFPFSNARQLFSPFDSGGQSQMHFPAPLWSTWPDPMQEAFWSSNNGPLYLADNLVPCQEAIGASKEPLFEP